VGNFSLPCFSTIMLLSYHGPKSNGTSLPLTKNTENVNQRKYLLLYVVSLRYFLTVIETNTKIWYQEVGLFCKLTMWYKSLQNWFVGGTWKSLKNLPMEKLECCNQSLQKIPVEFRRPEC
jgi:hypothetical protein